MNKIINDELILSKDVLKILNKIRKTYGIKINQTKEDKAFCDKINEIINKFNETIDTVKNESKNNNILFEWQTEFMEMISSLQSEIQENSMRDKPKYIDFKAYNEKAYSKLNYLFRRKKIMNIDEAKQVYGNADYLHSKYVEFLDLINWLNDNNLNIICEKNLFSGYLNIGVETYNELFANANEDVRLVFKNIDEGFTTQQFGALISNDRKSLERIQKTETYGQEMRQTQTDVQITNNTMAISFDDVMKKREKIKVDLKTNRNIIDYKEE